MTEHDKNGTSRFFAGYWISGLLAAATVLTSPYIVGSVISLDWVLGNIRSELFVLQILFGASASAAIMFRRRIDELCANVFPSKKHTLFVSFAVSIGLVVSMAIAEAGLRLFDYPYDASWTPIESAMGKFDPETGWSYKLNQETTQSFLSKIEEVGHSWRDISMYFDKYGARVASPDDTLDPEKPTVLFVGGSFTMGQGLTYEESFIGQLSTLTDLPIQYANFGVQGFGTDQSLVVLKRQLRDFNVKVAFYLYIPDHDRRNWNDDRRIFFPNGRWPGTKPAYRVKSDGTVDLRSTPRKMGFELYIWNLLKFAWYAKGPLPDRNLQRDLTRALVREMKAVSEQRGIKFFVLHWQDDPEQPDTLFREDFGADVIDLPRDPPADWKKWATPDGHTDSRAADHIARILASILEREFKPR